MKKLQVWLAARRMRSVKIWWHDRYDLAPGQAPEVWWHIELHECEPLADYGQCKQVGSWSKTEHVYSGYGKDLAVATRNALKVATKQSLLRDESGSTMVHVRRVPYTNRVEKIKVDKLG